MTAWLDPDAISRAMGDQDAIYQRPDPEAPAPSIAHRIAVALVVLALCLAVIAGAECFMRVVDDMANAQVEAGR